MPIVLQSHLSEWFEIKGGKRDELKIQHPATYPEKLVERLLFALTKEHDIIFDPFCGTGSTLIACLENNRCGIGVELSEKFASISKLRIEQTIREYSPSSWAIVLHDDISRVKKVRLPMIDAIITSPPYYNVLSGKLKARQKERQELGLATSYSDSPEDLGNIKEYGQFLSTLVDVFIATKPKLKENATLSIVVKNVKCKGKTYPLAFDLHDALCKHYIPMPEQIWVQDNIKLFPYAMFTESWVSNVCHSYVLSFLKKL